MVSPSVEALLKLPTKQSEEVGYDTDLAAQMPISIALLELINSKHADSITLEDLVRQSRDVLREIQVYVVERAADRELTNLENDWITKIVFLLSEENQASFDQKIKYLFETRPSKSRAKAA